MNKLPPWEQGVRQGGVMNQEQMIKNLLDLDDVFTKHDIPFTFIFGSLLGLIRDKGLIPYDHDADIMCKAEHHIKMKGVIEDMRKLGFTVPDKNETPIMDHFFIRGGEKIDLWWFIPYNDEYIYDQTVRYNKKYFDKFEHREWLGRAWIVPHNPEQFLLETYGDTWRIPNAKGHHIPK